MVMPHSALRTGQHLKWRGGNYKRKGGRNAPSIALNFRVQEPWDLDNVVPDFFPMPASVVFSQYVGIGQGDPLAPGTVQMWRGNCEKDYANITRKSEPLHHDDGKFKSPYAGMSGQGPTIVDRRLFFVEAVTHTAMLPAANTTNVRPRVTTQDKIKYEGQLNRLEGVVHNDHLFDVYLGECIVPYVALDTLKAALPAHRSTMTMPLGHDDCDGDKHDACQLEVEALHPTMQRRWNNAAEMYREAHKNQAIKDLYSRLNHQNILTSQLEYLQAAISGNGTTRIAYTTSGEPTAAIIGNSSAIVESSLYQTTCQSVDEAYYLLTVINSNELAAAAETFMARGLYGARHFHKHGWKLPIPRYEANDSLHASLSKLGKTAEQECQDLIDQSGIMSNTPGDNQSRAARRMLRHQWQPNSKTAQSIEATVAKLLSDPEQALLAKQQMETV